MVAALTVFAKAPFGVAWPVVADKTVDKVREDLFGVVFPPVDALLGILKVKALEVERRRSTTWAASHKTAGIGASRAGFFEVDCVDTEAENGVFWPELLRGPDVTKDLRRKGEVLREGITHNGGGFVVEDTVGTVAESSGVDATGPCEVNVGTEDLDCVATRTKIRCKRFCFWDACGFKVLQ